MKNFDYNKIENDFAKEIVKAILSDGVIKKHTIDYSWMSGSSTDVYPIMISSYNTEVYVDTGNGNLFRKAIERVLNKYPNLFKGAYFCKSDGSCPSWLRFNHSDSLMK